MAENSVREADGTHAWLLLAAGENRQYGGNEGYDDEPDAYYSWDSTVANHREVRPGDKVALWDGKTLLGASLVEDVEIRDNVKLRLRCRACNRTTLKPRATKRPRFRCYRCGEEMDVPASETIEVTAYRSRHDAAWVSLPDVLDGDTLRTLCVHSESIQSLRPLRWDDFRVAVGAAGGPDVGGIDRRQHSIEGGHREVTTRARIGQAKFRERLLDRFGSVCTVSGPAPASVLEAAHLYSYAAVGEHHDHGGLLLRRDIHRLYDDGDLAVDPTTMTVDLREPVREYPSYAGLQGAGLRVEVDDQQAAWFGEHWRQHR